MQVKVPDLHALAESRFRNPSEKEVLDSKHQWANTCNYPTDIEKLPTENDSKKTKQLSRIHLSCAKQQDLMGKELHMLFVLLPQP